MVPRARGIPLDVPFRQLTAEQRDLIIEGDPEDDFTGVNGFFAWLERKKYKLHVRVFLSRYRGYATCPDCGGTRLRTEARAVRIQGKSITKVCKLTVTEARQFFDSLELQPEAAAIAERILQEIQQQNGEKVSQIAEGVAAAQRAQETAQQQSKLASKLAAQMATKRRQAQSKINILNSAVFTKLSNRS